MTVPFLSLPALPHCVTYLLDRTGHIYIELAAQVLCSGPVLYRIPQERHAVQQKRNFCYISHAGALLRST